MYKSAYAYHWRWILAFDIYPCNFDSYNIWVCCKGHLPRNFIFWPLSGNTIILEMYVAEMVTAWGFAQSLRKYLDSFPEGKYKHVLLSSTNKYFLHNLLGTC